ncbi:MAG: hypothetical protein ACLFPL_03030 [Candidatus Nanoarchaeia archaeon]
MKKSPKNIFEIEDELEQIKYFKKIYGKIKTTLKQRSRCITKLRNLLRVLEYELDEKGSLILKIHFSEYIKEESQLHEFDLATSKLNLLYILKDSSKNNERKIREHYKGNQKSIDDFFDTFSYMRKLNSEIFSKLEKIESYNLTLKIVSYQTLKINYDKEGNPKKEFSYADNVKSELVRIIHKLNTDPHYDFFINFEKEIEEKEIRLENLDFIKQQKKAIKKDEEYKNLINEYNNKNSTFNFILAMGVFGTLFYYFYETLKDFYLMESLQISIISGILILLYILLFYFVLHIADLREEFISFFKKYWYLILILGTMILLFGFLLSVA